MLDSSQHSLWSVPYPPHRPVCKTAGPRVGERVPTRGGKKGQRQVFIFVVTHNTFYAPSAPRSENMLGCPVGGQPHLIGPLVVAGECGSAHSLRAPGGCCQLC